MRFFEPAYLFSLLVIPVLIGFFWWAVYRKKLLLARFGDMPLIMKAARGISFRRQAGKAALLIVAVLLLCFTLAQPQLGTHMEMVKHEGLDIVVAVDVSKSMDALDVQPGPISRLEKAKLQIRSLLSPERLHGDRIGLVAFAGEAFIQCPLTIDYSAARMFLDVIDTDIIPSRGTDLERAIRKSVTAFNEKERKHKVLILLTDGESQTGKPVDAAEDARKEGVKIYTVGIGSPAGEPIPIFNRREEKVGFKKDDEGKVVVSKLDEETLQKIALATGGKYYRATPSELELDKIFTDIGGMERKEMEGRLLLQYDDRFQWPLSLALAFMIWEVFVPERIRSRRERDLL
jgi:Ca-activated chloride channel family protein